MRPRTTVIAALLGFAVQGAVAAEISGLPRLAPDTSFTAKWDKCESLARQRGFPPAKVGYGNFMDACLEKPPAHERANARGSNATTGQAPASTTCDEPTRSCDQSEMKRPRRRSDPR